MDTPAPAWERVRVGACAQVAARGRAVTRTHLGWFARPDEVPGFAVVVNFDQANFSGPVRDTALRDTALRATADIACCT